MKLGERFAAVLVACVVASGCSLATDSLALDPAAEPQGVAAIESQPTGGRVATTTPPTTGAGTAGTTVPDPTTAPSTTTAAPTPPTTALATTPPSTIAPTTTLPSEVVLLAPHDPKCVVEVIEGDTLQLIADRFDDETVNPANLAAENGASVDVLEPGQTVDVCVGNGLDDVTGEQRLERSPEEIEAEGRRLIEAQQRKLNELFAGYGIRELLIDGVSGPVTRQRLCAARLALGLPVSTADLEIGSPEEQAIMAATSLEIPYTSSILSERWILIDRTCQIMFVGAGSGHLQFVFPTSTGSPGHDTRNQNRTAAFRYNPASGNGGWHNSTSYPVAADNPLNGNMYKPLYFDKGQAIHGANNVPTSPQSKGCARLRVDHQQMLVDWLGLGGVGHHTTDRGLLNVTVNVQGTYLPR